MEYKLIHISDLHFKLDSEEDQDVVLNAFFTDLKANLQNSKCDQNYLVFTGDIVKEGANPEQYSAFLEKFDSALDELGIGKDKRVLIAGNHDVSSSFIDANIEEHNEALLKGAEEKKFNDLIGNSECVLVNKFGNYIEFHNRFSTRLIDESNIAGYEIEVGEDISFYCLNTALCSNAGKVKDFKMLSIETRKLHKWCSSNTSTIKVLVMHHPLEWLSPWASKELKNLIDKNIDLVLTGHVHEQEIFCKTIGTEGSVFVSSPPLLTNKHGKLGYSILDACAESGVVKINYRQWCDKYCFVPGVDFTGDENGEIEFELMGPKFSNKRNFLKVKNYLKEKLDTALKSYSTVPTSWCNPIIRDIPETSFKPSQTEIKNIPIEEILGNDENIVFRAPPQFGLTCLARKIAYTAFCEKEDYYAYIDSSELKLSRVESNVKTQLSKAGLPLESLRGIVIDSWGSRSGEGAKYLNVISRIFPKVRLVVMQSLGDEVFGTIFKKDEEDTQEDLTIKFKVLYLWTLTKASLRLMVNNHRTKSLYEPEDQENRIVERIMNDFVTLNMHRTPLNCVTLLKASEGIVNDSLVNRSEVMSSVLFVLFNIDEIPSYQARPDMTDCKFVLGYFCEILIKENKTYFSHEEFMKIISEFFHEQQRMYLDIDVLFEILTINNIIVGLNGNYRFRYMYWVYFFAAERMTQEPDFCEYIFENGRYLEFPEIIEFYTGINRNRTDALKILQSDLEAKMKILDSECKLPDSINPYAVLEWQSDEELHSIMHKEMESGLQESNLPVEVKDDFSDATYDRSLPYYQNFRTASEAHLPSLMRALTASARALRNSDYAKIPVKKEMLNTISKCLEVLAKVFFIMSPELTEKRAASFSGQSFVLSNSFEEKDKQQLFTLILGAIPTNVTSRIKDDLYSSKMGPLIFDQIAIEDSFLRKHNFMRILIQKRPKDWEKEIATYVKSVERRSFYLADLRDVLHYEYQFGYLSNRDLKTIDVLIRTLAIKFLTGKENPGKKALASLDDDSFPERLVGDE